MTRNIDELNNLTTRAVEPERYFGEMDLTEEQVDKRLKYTKKANELFDVILILLLTMRDNGTLDYLYARDMLESWLLSLIAEFTTPDDYLIDYATDTAYNFIDTTKKHIDETWYTSSDRALYNAENSANDVLNYTEYIEALHSGKTHKKWITEPDNRVRKTHREVTKEPISIQEVFHVGFALMRFPKDYDLAMSFPEELVNCRCQIKYLPDDKHNAGGNVHFPEGFDKIKYKDEVEDAYWLANNYGGEVELLKKSEEHGVKTPDYKWNNKLWELKSTSSSKSVDSALRKGIEQIRKNPGGIILDFQNNEFNTEEMLYYLNDRLRRSGKFDFDVMILKKGELFKYIKHKYKK